MTTFVAFVHAADDLDALPFRTPTVTLRSMRHVSVSTTMTFWPPSSEFSSAAADTSSRVLKGFRSDRNVNRAARLQLLFRIRGLHPDLHRGCVRIHRRDSLL